MTGVELFAIGSTAVTLGDALLAVGALSAAAGAAASGFSQASASDFNAAVSQQNAEIAIEEGRVEEDRRRQDARRVLARNRTAVGASGLLFEGSPADLQEDAATELEINALQARRDAQLRARGFNVQSTIDTLSADAARTRGTLGSATALLQGAGNIGRFRRA